MPKVIFNNSNRSFFQSVKLSVDAYFSSRQLKRTGNWKLYAKALILIPSAIAIYVYLLFGNYIGIMGMLLSALFGLTLVCIAFNVMHDACHGSYSEKKWINDLMGFSMNALGSNAFIWKIKHNIVHHTYTNIDGIDDDISNGPLLRQCVTQKWMPLHRFQFLYMFVEITLIQLHIYMSGLLQAFYLLEYLHLRSLPQNSPKIINLESE